MSDLVRPVESAKDIPPHVRGTPIEELLQYHNLDRELTPLQAPRLLIGMCMDNRKHQHIPDNFAFILRAGGANLRPSEFKVSYAFEIGSEIDFTLSETKRLRRRYPGVIVAPLHYKVEDNRLYLLSGD